MIKPSFPVVINFKKPGRLWQPGRLFFIVYFLIFLYSCSSGKQIAGTAPAEKKRISSALPPVKDSLILPEVADAIFIDAVKAKMLNRTDDAYRQFSLLASTGNLGATPHYELSKIWLERNNVPRALNEIKLATQKDSLNKWFQTQFADLLAYDGQYLKAAEVYKKLSAKERYPQDYLMREAMLYQKAEQYKEALVVLEQLEQLVGEDDESVLLQKQQLYLNLNDVKGAAKEVEKLILYYPQEPRYLLLLGDLYENNNIKTDVEQIYKRAEAKFPNEPAVQFALVQYYLKKKDTTQFQVYLEKAIMNKEVPVEDRISLLAPFIQFKGADSSAKHMAFDLAGKLARQQPPKAEAMMLYGDMLAADNQLTGALEQYKNAIGIDSSDFNAWQQILFIYTSRLQVDSLIHYSERAAANFPKESLVYYFGGVGYMQAKNYSKSEGFLLKAVELQTKGRGNLLPEIYVTLGDVYNSDGKFRLSDSFYRAALILQPDNANALNNFSYYLSVRGENLEEAEQMSAKSLKLRPDEATFLDTYGWILYKQGKYKDARDYLQKAIDNTKDDADATLWEHLGDAEYKMGNKQQALEHWKKAKEKGEVSELLQQKINEQKLND